MRFVNGSQSVNFAMSGQALATLASSFFPFRLEVCEDSALGLLYSLLCIKYLLRLFLFFLFGSYILYI